MKSMYRIGIFLLLTGCLVLTIMSLTELNFFTLKDVKLNNDKTADMTFGLKHVCYTEDKKEKCIEMNNDEMFKNKAIFNTVNEFMGWYYIAYIILVIVIIVMLLINVYLMVKKSKFWKYALNLLLMLISICLFVMFMALLGCPKILKKKGLDGKTIKNEYNVTMFNDVIVPPKNWDRGITYLIIMTVAMIISWLMSSVAK